MERHRVGIVVPALNESESIGIIVNKAAKYGQVIVVDDGSYDDTGSNALNAGAIVVQHLDNLGYDAALNSGFTKASELHCKVVLTIDADGQHDTRLIKRFLDKVSSGYDVVIGLRDKKQRIAEHVFAYYTNQRWGIQDPLCGMKAYRMKVYNQLGHFGW